MIGMKPHLVAVIDRSNVRIIGIQKLNNYASSLGCPKKAWNGSFRKAIFVTLCVMMLMIPNNSLHAQEKPGQTEIDPYELNLSELSRLKITSASKVTQKISEVPATVFIVTAKQIKENGYFTLEEALSDLPGFQFRNILGINSYVFQRGIPNQNNLTLLLIDGVQINELNSGGFYAGGLYNLSNIDHIEVISGPSSVAYGTNAVSGIINIITRSATEKRLEVNTLVGSFNTTKSDLNYCYTDEKKNLGIQIAGMVKKSDKANLKGQAGDNNWTDLMDNFENDYSLDVKVRLKDFVFGTNYLNKRASTATLIKSVGTDYRDYGTEWNIQFVNNYLKYNKKINEKFSYSSILYNRNATVLDNTIYYVVDTAQIGYYRPNNLTGFENILNYDFSPIYSMTGGLTFECEQLSEKASMSYSHSPSRKPPKPLKPGMDKNNLTSLFVESRLTPIRNLFLSGGVRFDQSSIYDQVLTPRAGLCYNFKGHSFRFAYADAFRAPKPWDYTDGLGNSSLLPEKMKSLETALTLSLAEDVMVDFIGYKNKLNSAITKEVTNEGFRWVNSGQIKTNGLEIYLRANAHKFNFAFNYTYNESKNELGQWVPEISKHSANANISYSLNNYIKMNLRSNYIGERENPAVIASTNSKLIEPCLIFHGALSVLNYKGFDIQLFAKNILNAAYYHTSNREPGRYRQPQRTIMFSIGYSL
jgi:outer membrane cobalamin receptor